MKLLHTRLTPLLALAAGALLLTPSAPAATAVDGDIYLGVRAESGTGATKTFVINLGQVSQFETATTAMPITNIGADLVATYGSTWFTRSNLRWGIAGGIGSFAPIGSDPAKTVFGSRSTAVAWNRQNDATHGAAANKMVSLRTAFNSSSSIGVTASNAVLQNITDTNNWASYQPGGTTVNAGPPPGYSFAFFNPHIENTFENGVAGAVLHFYRVKPATSGAELDTPGDYLGRFVISESGDVAFVPVSAFGSNTVDIGSATYSVNEEDGSLDVTVVRSGDVSSTASVTIGATEASATDPEDYSFAGGVVSFDVGESVKTQTITIVNRSGFQGNRGFTLSLSSPTNAAVGSVGSSMVTITEAIEPSVIDLVSAQVDVNAEAASVNIPVSRSGGMSPVTIDIATADGTAAAGVDYVTPTGGAQTVSVAADATSANAIVALTSATITTNKTFSVTLTNPGANASVGATSPTTTIVRILAQDAVAPTIGISSPAANAVFQIGDGPMFQIQGTASDNVNVERVQLSFNGGSFVNINTSGLNPSWSRTVTAVGGVNTIAVRAVDSRGNVSATAMRSFTYQKKGGLTVAVTPDAKSGTVTGMLKGDSAYEVGKTYMLKAAAKAGFAFAGWTVPGLTGPDTEGPVLNFVYTDAILASPTITANFVAAPFDANEIGDFNGLVTPHAGTASNNSTHGAMKLTLTKTGSFSGTLLIDGFKLTIPASMFTSSGSGRFGASATTSMLVQRKTKPALELADVQWDSATNTITGVIRQYYRSAVVATSDFTLYRAAFNAKEKIPANSPYLANKGVFSVIIPTKAQTNGLTAVDFPQGDGVGTITLTSNGILKLAAKLADDTSVTASVPLNSDLQAPLFAQIYSNKGSYSALVQLDSTQTDSDLKGVDTVWFRPWQDAQQWYPWGWEEGVILDLFGASYSPAGLVVPGVTETADAATANAQLMFNDGLLANSITADVNINGKNAVKTLSNSDADAKSFTLALKAASGDFSGSFTHTDGTKPKYVGKIYQKGPNAGGYGYFLSTKPKVVDGLGESGGLTLEPK